MTVVSTLASIAENDVFKLLQIYGGDPLAFVMAGAQIAGAAKHRAAIWRQERSNRRLTLGDGEEAARTVLAGIHRVDSDKVPSQAVQHLLMILEAFGEAWARTRFSLPGEPSPQKVDVTERFGTVLTWRWQQVFKQNPSDGPAALDWLTRQSSEEPLRSPHYQALWQTLIDQSFEPPLFDPQHRLLFEQNFRLAYSVALASPTGQAVRQHLAGMESERPKFLRILLQSDLAGWDGRQVFGNTLRPDEGRPDLPLGALYVEPNACLQKREPEPPQPVLSLLRELLAQHPIVAVSAAMGLGKSLTARTLAAAFAREWLASPDTSTEVTLPIFVRCADALDAQNVQNLPHVVKRALQHHSRQLGFDLPLDDPALAPPSSSQKVLYILDGLDEVVLTDPQVRDLFTHLDHKRSANVRFLVLSRPQTLEPLRQPELQSLATPVVEIQPFTTKGEYCQAAEWLNRWNQQVRVPQAKEPIFWPNVQGRNLTELAQTPILLFIIAETWDALPDQTVNQASLYEQFFQQLARGKHERDQGAQHKNIHEASKPLLQRLVDRRFLQKEATEPDAMLWLMGRIAWKHLCLEQRTESLRKHHVVSILREELKLKEASETVYQIIASGLMLALQADLLSEDPAILFGHKSFREFLVGRYWANQLRRLLRVLPQEDRGPWAPILEGRLLAVEDRSVEFLCDILQREETRVGTDQPNSVLVDLLKWLEQQFQDSSQDFPDLAVLDDDAVQRYALSLFHDRRAVFREAVLSIGSHLAERLGRPGLEATDRYTLRSLLSWFWIQQGAAIIYAPGLRHPCAHLQGANLYGANLHGADLHGANLQDANLQDANLQDANLRGARLYGANLKRANPAAANLEMANLATARLNMANLKGTNLHQANLREASLGWANLQGANLQGALLEWANLQNADLRGANLQGANLFRCSLQGARLLHANLTDARYDWDDLNGANLEGAIGLRDRETPSSSADVSATA